MSDEPTVDPDEQQAREREQPDGWDARTADEEQIPQEDIDDPDLPGNPREYEPPVDDEVIPGAPQRQTGDATEGGAGRP